MSNNNPYFRPNQPRLLHVERAIWSCLETYLVTLTTKRRLSSDTFANDIRETFNRVNGKLFGTAFKRGRSLYNEGHLHPRRFRRAVRPHQHPLIIPWTRATVHRASARPGTLNVTLGQTPVRP